MNTDINIKNFRIFNHEGVDVPISPITILTGCNNVGKSSIVKALCLLKDFCQQLKEDIENGRKLQLDRYKLDFHKSPNNLMGDFNGVLHKNKRRNYNNSDSEYDDEKNKRIIFELIVESSWLLQDVILHLEFGPLEWDDLKNGYLLEYTIKTLDGRVIYTAKRGGGASMDFRSVKKSLLYFLYGQYVFSKWQNTVAYRTATDSYPAGEDKDCKLFNEISNGILEELGGVALIYLYEWQLSHCSLPWRDGHTSAAKAILKSDEDDTVVLNSPLLGVYCFFPCLRIFKDFEKVDAIQKIELLLKNQEASIPSLDKKIVELFLKSFKNSNAKSLDEYVGIMEDKRFFVNSHFDNFYERSFAYPRSFWNMEIDAFPYEESTLPETANWSIVLSAMDILNRISEDSSDSYIEFDEINDCLKYKTENYIDDYLTSIIEDIFARLLPGSLTYSSTTLLHPKRLYSLEEKDDFARALRKYFEVKRLYKEHNDVSLSLLHGSECKRYEPCSFINKWLNELGLAHHVEIKSHVDGYGVTIHLFGDENDEDGMQLIDKGLGISQLFAVLLRMENAILEMKLNDILYVPYTMGINKEIIKYFRNYSGLNPVTVALEEPECHLHPSFQAKIADIIVDANERYGVNFIIESHSEYLIRRLQVLVGSKKIGNDNISLLYINPVNRPEYMDGITDIGIEKDGTLKNEFGSGFFDESFRLTRELYKSNIDVHEE